MAQAEPTVPSRIVFFDGVCRFCDGAVRWVRDHDPGGGFHFAPLQGETAARIRGSHPDDFPADIDTIVYVETGSAGTRIFVRAEAVFELCAHLDGRWRWLAGLRVLPHWLTDLGYRAFAANRYRIFGRLDACEISTEEEQTRMLR